MNDGLTLDQKRWIDDASYQTLLRIWRNAPAGDPMFVRGAAFDYYDAAMKRKKAEVGPGGAVAASKVIGW